MRESTTAGRAALAVAALAGAITAFAILRVLGATGDEPPIRVRNGSIELHLLSAAETWKQTGNHWKITGGKRSSDDYQVVVAYKPGATCAGNGSATGAPLRITHKDLNVTKYVELKVNGKHTEVESDADLQISADGKVLSYTSSTGFIDSISVNSKSVCTFTEASQLENLFILDF